MKDNIVEKFYETLKLVEDVITDKITTNIQLEELCQYLFEDSFLGVFSSNNYPKTNLKDGDCFIMNTSSSREEGQHWISCYVDKDHINKDGLIVFDSFGRDVHQLSSYFKHKHFILGIKKRLQSYQSYSCGAFSVTFLIMYFHYKDKFIKYINL